MDSSASFAQSSTEESGKEDLLKPAVIESGPIGIESAVDEVDNEVEYDDEADEEPISASQLLGLGLADEGIFRLQLFKIHCLDFKVFIFS